MRAKTSGLWIMSIGVGLACQTTAAADGARAIFRCEVDGVVTFSDRPCTPSAERYEPDPTAMNIHEAPPARPASRRDAVNPKAKQRPSGPAAEPSKHKATCERLAQRMKDVRAKLRAGYSASEGERLKDRQARLKSQLRTARCG